MSSLKIYTIFLGQLFLSGTGGTQPILAQSTDKKTKTNLFNCPVRCCYVLLYTLSHSNHFKEKEVKKTKQKTHEKTVTYPQHIQSFLFMRHLRLSLKFSSVSDKNSFCE